MRSKKVSYAPNELSASASGALSVTDIRNDETLANAYLCREIIEELGLETRDIIEDSVIFLGLTRDIIRGGKPEMFFKMRTDLSYIEVKKAGNCNRLLGE